MERPGQVGGAVGAVAFHAAHGHSWERRWNADRRADGSGSEDGGRHASLINGRLERSTQQCKEAGQLQPEADRGRGTAAVVAEVSPSSLCSLVGWLLVHLLLLPLSIVALSLLCFRAGQRWERQKQYELIR